MMPSVFPAEIVVSDEMRDDMSDEKHIIWSNCDLDLDDWRDDLAEEYPDKSEDELYAIMCETNDHYLDDERANLDIQLRMPILLIADIGRWDGRHNGYREIKSGNIRDCLYTGMDYATFYVDKQGDLRCDAHHHDGTNHYLYRVYRRGISGSQIERLQEKILDGTATRKDITRLTQRLGDPIGKVYGWRFPKPQEIER